MNRDNDNPSTPSSNLTSLFRGLYGRVARHLGVDPSYVSRVARGERRSAAVQAAINDEVKAILDNANHDGHKPFAAPLQRGKPSDGLRDNDGQGAGDGKALNSSVRFPVDGHDGHDGANSSPKHDGKSSILTKAAAIRGVDGAALRKTKRSPKSLR